MPTHPDDGNGLPPPGEEEEAATEEERQEAAERQQQLEAERQLRQQQLEADRQQRQQLDADRQLRQQQLEAERQQQLGAAAALAEHEQEEIRRRQDAERQRAALMRQQAEDLANSVAANHSGVTMRRRRGASVGDRGGAAVDSSTTDGMTMQQMRTELALARDHIALQNRMREMESRLNRAENMGMSLAPTTIPGEERPEPAPQQQRPLHGTPTTPFVEDAVDNPEEIAERATRRLIVPPLRPFTGARSSKEGADEQPFSSWIRSFEQEMALAMINRTAWLKTLRYFLQDAAATVYDSRINCLPHDRRTYQGMVEVLRHTYDRCVKEREAQRALCNLHWDPKTCTIDEFYARVEKIAASAYPQFDDGARQRLVTRQFIEAMPPTTQRQIDTRIDLSLVPQAIQSFQVLDWAREITRQEEKYSESARAYKLAMGGGKGSPGADHQAPGEVNAQQPSLPRPLFGDRGRGWRGNRSSWRGAPRGGGWRGRNDFQQNNSFNGRGSMFPTHNGMMRPPALSTGPGWQQSGRGSPPMRGYQLPRGGMQQQPRGGASGRTVRDVSEINCFNCNQKGHYARACTQAPAITTKLIKFNRVGMISAAKDDGKQPPPQQMGRELAESAKMMRPTSAPEVKTVFNGKKKKNVKKKPSPPRNEFEKENSSSTEFEKENSPLPLDGLYRESPSTVSSQLMAEAETSNDKEPAPRPEKTSSRKNDPSEPTEQEPTPEEPTPKEPASEEPTSEEPTPEGLHSASELERTPLPTEHKSAMKEELSLLLEKYKPTKSDVTSLLEQYNSASGKENWHGAKEEEEECFGAIEQQQTSAPTEHEPTMDEPTPKEHESASGEKESKEKWEKEVRSPTEQKPTQKSKEKMKISPKNIISTESPQGESMKIAGMVNGQPATSHPTKRWQLKKRLKEVISEKRSGFQMEMFLLKRVRKGKKNGKRERMMIPRKNTIFAGTSESEFTEKEVNKETSPPTEQETTPEFEEEASPPTEQQPTPEPPLDGQYRESPSIVSSQPMADVSIKESKKEKKKRKKKEKKAKEKELSLPTEQGTTSEFREEASPPTEQQPTPEPPLDGHYRESPSLVSSQPLAEYLQMNDSKPTSRSENQSVNVNEQQISWGEVNLSMPSEQQSTPETPLDGHYRESPSLASSQLMAEKSNHQKPAADEQQPADVVHADPSDDEESATETDVNTVHQLDSDGKRNRRNERKKRKWRKKIDADSGERQQQAADAQKGRPYKETRLMTIPVVLNGRQASAQIDTGSPISLVGRRPILCLIAKFGRDFVRTMVKPLPKSHYDYSGNEIELKGTIALDLQLMGTRLKFNAYIDSTAHRDLIIGMDILAKTGCALRLYTDGGLTDLIVSKPQKDGKSIVTLAGGGRDITNTMVLAEQRFLERRKEDLDNNRKRNTDRKPPTHQQQENAVRMITVEPRTRKFIQLRLKEPKGSADGCKPAVVLVEEACNDADGGGVRIPPQLVEWMDGCVWLEVRNEDDASRSLHLEQLQVTSTTDFTLQPPWLEDDGSTEWVMRVPECGLDDLNGIWQPRVSQLQPYDEPMYLEGLQYTSLDERRKDLLAAFDVGDAKGDITEQDRQELIDLLIRNHDVLALTDDELGCCTLPEHAHAIDTGDTPPIAQPLRRLAMTKQIEVRKTLNTMKRTGVIQASCSPWSSPIVPVWKRDGSMRITVDYRRLNEVTKKDRYPLSRCDELIDSMGLERPKFFTTLDLVQGFHQMRIADDAVEKTAFSCQEGHFEYLRMPMGLTNSPASFQRLQNEILKGTDPNKVKVYLDDVAIATNTFKDHLLQLGIVFARFRKAGLRVKVSKCKFLKEKLVYLGFEISKEGVRPNEARIWDVQDFKPPTTVKMVRQFVGLCSFYRRFVPNFSKIARPLTNLTRKDEGWKWGEKQAKAFQQLKDLLTSKDILAYPQWGKPYYILCDASSQGLGAILHQKDELGRYRPIAYASRATDKYEQKYGASELECLCLVWALQHFHYYIWGQEIYVESDHQPLTCLNSKQTLPPRLERWNSIIIPYAPKIIYRRGKENEPADALSRYQKLAGTADESAMDAVVRVIKNYPDPDVDLEEVDKNVKERQRQLQMNDPFWSRIIEAKEEQKGGRPVTRMIGRMAEKYRLLEGVLYFIGNDSEASPRLCVPQVERRVMIERYHEQRGVGGHLGAEKVYMAIAAGHFWPSMKTQVEQYCRECRVCLEQRGGAPRHKPPLSPIPAEAQPFVQVQIDVMNLPKTKKGNKKVLGIVDSFTGYLIYVPMKNEEATTVARKLHKHLFTRFNAPKRMLSDNGTNFHSNVISELNKRYGVKHYFTTTFTPHSNGKTEKANSTMRQMLAKMTQDHPEDWDELVADVMWAYNTTPIPTTGFSPHFLVFGSNPAVVSDSVFDWPTLGESLEYDDYISKLERRRAEALKIADVNRSVTQEQQKARYDKKSTLTSIVLGEKVMVYRPNLKTDKLKPKFDGPYEVVWLSDTVAKVRRLVDGVIETHNLDKLSRCSPTAQVTNKNQPYKPRKYQKGKKIPKKSAKDLKVKKVGWNENQNGKEWWEFFEETPETASIKQETTNDAAYTGTSRHEMGNLPKTSKSSTYGQKILMFKGKYDRQDSLRCMFCNSFKCKCEDQSEKGARFESTDESSILVTSRMSESDDDMGELSDEAEKRMERIVFEGDPEFDQPVPPKAVAPPSVGRHRESPAGVSTDQMASTSTSTAAAASSSNKDVEMKKREKDFYESSSEDEDGNRKRPQTRPTVRLTQAQLDRLFEGSGDDDDGMDYDDGDGEERKDVDWEGLFKWARCEKVTYKNPEELRRIKLAWDSTRRRDSSPRRNKETLKNATKRARHVLRLRRADALAAGLEDPELTKMKRNLGTVYPREIEEKLQVAQRRNTNEPQNPQVEAMETFEAEEVVDIEMAAEEKHKTVRTVRERKQELEKQIHQQGIAKAMRTPVTAAPSSRHRESPAGVYEKHCYNKIKQSKHQIIATGTCYPTDEQGDELSPYMIAEIAGIGATTVKQNEIGETKLGLRDRPLVAATYPALLEANPERLQQEYNAVYNATQLPDDPKRQRQAARPVDNTAVFFNGDMAKLDVEQALQLKSRQPTEIFLPAAATVVQEVPSAGPLSGATTQIESLARMTPGYVQRLVEQLEETKLMDVAATMTKTAYIDEAEYDLISRRQDEVRLMGKIEVIQRTSSTNLPADVALHQIHPVKVARGTTAAASSGEAAEGKWNDDDPEALRQLKMAQQEADRQTRIQYDSMRRITEERRKELTKGSEDLDLEEIVGKPPGGKAPERLVRALHDDQRRVERREVEKGDSEIDENADLESQRVEVMKQLRTHRHMHSHRAGGFLHKLRQLTGPGQIPEESKDYRDAVERQQRYIKGIDREGGEIDVAELEMLRLEQTRRDQYHGYKLYRIKDPASGQPVWFEEVNKGKVGDVYADYPDMTEERRNMMTEFIVTDLAMEQYNRDTDLFNNDAYQKKYFEMVSSDRFVSPMTKAVFKRNLLMPKHVLRDSPPVIANRAWQLMSQRADERCTQLPTKVTKMLTDDPEDEKDWMACAYSYDQAGSILRSHFMQDYRIEPVMRYVCRHSELGPAIDWLLRKPDLEGIVTDNDVQFLGWDLENGASGVEWKHWRPPLKSIYNVTPFVKTVCGPFPVLLTLSNCWGYTAVIDLRFTRGLPRTDGELSPMPSLIEKLLGDEYEHVKFVCFDLRAENIAWYNGWGKTLPKKRFIDLQEIGERQLRLCANGILYTIDPQGKRVPTELGLGKAIYAFTGDFDTALEKAGFLKQYNPLNFDNPSTKYLKMPEVIAGNICDLRYAAKDSIFTLFLTMRVCLVDFYTQHEKRRKDRTRPEGTRSARTAYQQMVDWVKQIASTEPEQLQNRMCERLFTGGLELPKSVKLVMEEVGKRLANDLTAIERKRDAPDSAMKIQLPFLTEITTGNEFGEPIHLPRDTQDIKTFTMTERDALTPRQWLDRHGLIPVPSRHEWAQLAISNALQIAIRYVDEWMHINDDGHKTAAMQGAVHMWREFEKRWQERYDEREPDSSLRKQLEYEHAATALRMHMSDETRTITLNSTVNATRLLSAMPKAQQTHPGFLHLLDNQMRKNSIRSERLRVAKAARARQDFYARETAKGTDQEMIKRRMMTLGASQKMRDVRQGGIRGVKETNEEVQRGRHLKRLAVLKSGDRGSLTAKSQTHPSPVVSHALPSGTQEASSTKRRSSSARRPLPDLQVSFQPARRGTSRREVKDHRPRRQSSSDGSDMDGLERETEKEGKKYPKTPYNPPEAPPPRMVMHNRTPMAKFAPIASSQEAMWTSSSAVPGSSYRQAETTTTDADSPTKNIRPLYPMGRGLSAEMKQDALLHQLLCVGCDGWGALRQFLGKESMSAYSEVSKKAAQILQAAGKKELTDDESRRAIRDWNRDSNTPMDSADEQARSMPPPKSSVSTGTGTPHGPLQQQGHVSRAHQPRPQSGSQRRSSLPPTIQQTRRVVIDSTPSVEIRVEREPLFKGDVLRRISPGAPIEYDVNRRTRYGMQTDYLYHPMQAVYELATIRQTELLALKEEAKEHAALKKHHPRHHKCLENYIQHVRDRLQVLQQVLADWNMASKVKTASEREEAENGFYVMLYHATGPKLQHLLVPRVYGWEYDGQWLKMTTDGILEDVDLNYLLPKPRPTSTEASTQEDTDSNPWG